MFELTWACICTFRNSNTLQTQCTALVASQVASVTHHESQQTMNRGSMSTCVVSSQADTSYMQSLSDMMNAGFAAGFERQGG